MKFFSKKWWGIFCSAQLKFNSARVKQNEIFHFKKTDLHFEYRKLFYILITSPEQEDEIFDCINSLFPTFQSIFLQLYVVYSLACG